MARGHQKIQSQQKNAEKQAKLKKAQGHKAGDQKAAAQKAMKFVCSVCRAQMMDKITYKDHFTNKHSKLPLPAELTA